MKGKLLIIAVALFAVAAGTLATAALAGKGGAGSDGRYEGRYTDGKASKQGEIKLRVKSNAGKIVRFRTVTTAVCLNVNAIGGIEVVPVAVSFDRIKVNGKGRFSKKIRQVNKRNDYKQTYRVSGRLAGKRVKASNLRLEGRCVADRPFEAQRQR